MARSHTTGGRDRSGSVLLLHVVLGLAIALVPVFVTRRFYFQDDMQHQFMPMFYHIGFLLRLGEWPILTMATWHGSNILGEFQFALFNPVSLITYLVLPSIPDYELGAAFLACVYYAILTPGVYVLSRTFGLERRWASLIAFAAASGNFLSYWGASNWFPIFSSCAFLVWAWAFLRLAATSRVSFLAAVAFSFLTITCGFPHAILMLGFVGLVSALELGSVQRSWRPVIIVGISLCCAVLLSAVPILATAAMGPLSTRTNLVANGDFLTPNLRDLLQVSMPTHLGFMNIYGGFQPVRVPIFYVAWFLLPLAALMDWSAISRRDPALIALLILGGLIFWSIQGPENLLLIRYFLRWLPYLHIALLILFFLVLQRSGLRIERTRLILASALSVGTTILAIQVTPVLALPHLLALVAATLAFAAVVGSRRRPRLQLAVLGGASALIFITIHVAVPRNANFGDWNSPAPVAPGAASFDGTAPTRFAMYLIPFGDSSDPGRVDEYRSGYAMLEWGIPTINGYTGTGHRPLNALLCMEWAGQVCPEAANALFAIEPVTGLRYAGLMRIDTIVVRKGPHLDALLPLLPDRWQLVLDNERTQRFVRDLPSVPGTVAWATPGLDVQSEGQARIQHETLRVINHTDQPARIVFSRLWWPGYHASLAGVDLLITAFEGIFVSVEVPPGASGELELTYGPPALGFGLGLMVLGASVMLITVFAAGGASRPSRPPPTAPLTAARKA